MSHMLAISIGPVQELIAAARRTRDLWFGSHLLSEISRAAAKAVEEEHRGTLIFPESSDAENIANVILAELPEGDPKETAEKAKLAAKARWRQFADQVRHDESAAIRAEIWDGQVGDVIEFYAAWVSHDEPKNYQADRDRLMRLLAGRKSFRDFQPAQGEAGAPKSSLDGQRESVLKPPEEWPCGSHARLRLRKGEQLDVIGLVKRAAEGHQSYPSVTRIAADPWVRRHQRQLEQVANACEQLAGEGIVRRLDTTRHPRFDAFPYEGAAVYTQRHHELREETDAAIEQLAPLREALARLPQPEPYLAVLVADGDKIGAAISALESPDVHRKFSRTLAEFARGAREIVEDCSGVLVYAGGDDVLAFLPVDKCLKCARRLHDDFAKQLASYGGPTLSVGIAIGHFMESLEDLLEYGRDAEKAAKKPERDGLAVHLHKRGGAPIRIRAKWTENPSPDDRLANYARLIAAEAISSKLPYDLRKLAELYETWPRETVATALRQDVERVIRDKQPRAGRRDMPESVQQNLVVQASRLLPAAGTATPQPRFVRRSNEIKVALEMLSDAESLHGFARELLVARQLAAGLRQAGERPERQMEAAS